MARHITINALDIEATSTESYGRLIARGADNSLHVVWRTAPAGGFRVVRYATSPDEGATWANGLGGPSGSIFNVSDPLQDSVNPAIAMDSSGALHVVWRDVTDGQLYYRRRSPAGTWSAIDALSLAAAGKSVDKPNIIVAPNGSVHLVAWNTTDVQIYWAHSTDGGATWTVNPGTITGGAGSMPKIGLDADSMNNLHLVFIRSTNKAGYAKATFTTPSTWVWGAVDTASLNDPTVLTQGNCEVVVQPDDDVIAIWEALFSGTTGIRLRWARRPGGTGTWTAQRNAIFTTTTTTAYKNPVAGIASDGDVYLVSNHDRSSGSTRLGEFVMLADSPGNGTFITPSTAAQSFAGFHDVFGEEEVLGSRFPQVPRRINPTDKLIPALFVDSVNLRLKLTTFNSRLDAVHTENAANTLSLPERSILIRTSPTTLHVVFQKTTAPIQLLYKKSTDGGRTWTDGEGGAPGSSFVIDSPSATRQGPNMAINAAGDIFLVWSDVTTTSKMYLRKRVAGVWSAMDSVTLSVTGKNLRNPAILIDKFQNIHVIAWNRTDSTLYHAYSPDNGNSWTVTPSVVILDSSFTFGAGTLRLERDAANNLHVVTQRANNLSHIFAAFTSPATWTWGTPDNLSFQHPDQLEDVFSAYDVSADYGDTVGRRLDLVWVSQGAGGSEDRRTLYHGTIISGVKSFTVLGQFTNTNFTQVRARPSPGNLARDAQGHLYCVINWSTLSGSIGSTVMVLQKGTSAWQNLLPIVRLSNTLYGRTIERRPVFASPGDIYGIGVGTVTSGDDHSTLLIEPLAGSIQILTVSQLLTSQTEIATDIVSKDFLAVTLLDKDGLSDKEGNVRVTQTVPAAPALLTAADLKTGDSIRLVWSGTGPFYNVYFKVTGSGDPFTRAHASPLPGSQTQYDVGGLNTGVSYTFLVRGVNGAGTEGPDSNMLTATPTLDLSISKFSSPVWSVLVNGAPRLDAVLDSVELGYGADVSNAVFVIHKDPDAGGFPQYDDSVDIVINGRTVLRGRIKGITSRISQSGLTKTFTVISNITKFQEKAVPIGKDHWNAERDREGRILDRKNANEILQELLGFVPSGTPTEFPGEVHVTDQTLLDAAETVLRRLGNYKVFFNQNSEQLEAYRFGQGGDATRQFIKGQNILDFSLTENRQDVVDKLTLVGPPRVLRVEEVVGFPQELSLIEDETGASRRAFILSKPNVRDIQVFGTQKSEPGLTFDEQIEVIPEDFDNLLDATWPVPFILGGGFVENVGVGDAGMKRAIKVRGFTSAITAPINASIVYESPDKTTVFLSEFPLIRDHILHSGTVQNRKIGILPLDGTTFVQVYLGTSVFFGGLKVRYTHDGQKPIVTIGGGAVERTLTDTQYQILINNVPGESFSNEAEVLGIMQKRAQAEFERLNRPRISGTISVIGDETIDLRSTIIVNGQKLDVVKVLHNFTNGFTTQVALTNEPFVATLVSAIPQPERRTRAERTASTEFRITVLEDVEIDKNIAALRQQELQKRLQLASTSHAVYQD